ncbi:MAG: YbaK/EbsC family protein [candidate division Zixibacteria bacterium]|nr:YbaK/EbsC family protein [candidate division Zixibacteria bacterium]MDD5425138.1 YbaK/EbsC family protein [candidate division Zixibacteria bacterium]
MPVKRLKEFLDLHRASYCTINHSLAYTAHEIAACVHIPAREVAKTVIVKVDGKMTMVVLPAAFRIDLKLLQEITDAYNVELATEDEFKASFPECAVGAMPPFGNLYDMDVYVADSLAENEYIAFNAGSHTEIIKMTYRDFERLVEPVVIDLVLR